MAYKKIRANVEMKAKSHNVLAALFYRILAFPCLEKVDKFS
jgi:hypothetical protein